MLISRIKILADPRSTTRKIDKLSVLDMKSCIGGKATSDKLIVVIFLFPSSF